LHEAGRQPSDDPNLDLLTCVTANLTEVTCNLGLLNVRSICNKADLIHELIVDKKLKIMCLTETWIREGDDPFIGAMCPSNFYFISAPRPPSKGKKGGGVGFVISSDIVVERIDTEQYDTFESLAIRVKGERPFHLFLIYRPPPSQANGLSMNQFHNEIELFLTYLSVSIKGDFCVLGDFNVHWDAAQDPAAVRFRDLVSVLDMKQLVAKPTQKSGHILDLMLVQNSCNRVVPEDISDPNLSDHSLILSSLQLRSLRLPSRQVTVRPLRRVDADALAADLRQKLASIPDGDADELAAAYKDLTLGVMNAHAPMKKIKIKGEVQKAWYDDEIHAARIERRRLERRYRKSGLVVHKSLYDDQARNVVRMIIAKKKEYYETKLTTASPKETANLIRSLLHSSSSDHKLPAANSDQTLCDEFQRFFKSKIDTIRASINAHPVQNADGNEAANPQDLCLTTFTIQTQEQVCQVIKNCAPKSCSLDTIPTVLLKENHVLQAVSPILTKIINQSLETGQVPVSFKEAVIRPALKKPDADENELKNYRPISNICFPAKILEKIVAEQLIDHLTESNKMDPRQSAYQKGISCETALVMVKNEVDSMLGSGRAVLMVMLDLSAAFDTIDHNILLHRLEDVGIGGRALTWFQDYLKERTQKVKINDACSQSCDLSVGVPQGSVLGPLLFLCYILPLQRIIERHGILRHGYADDSQLYCPLTVGDAANTQQEVRRMERCIDDIRSWMYANKLKLNEDKTEVLVVARKCDALKLGDIQVRVGDALISPKRKVKNLGAYFDDEMSMRPHVMDLTRRASYHLRGISHIRPYLTEAACARAINASVTSRLDFHNALLLGAPKGLLRKLQLIQNSAARILTKTPSRQHITPTLMRLHWLPIESRIVFKAMCMVHHAIHAGTPRYLHDICQFEEPTRPLRSNDDNMRLMLRRTNNALADRAFSQLAFRHWNNLPLTLRQLDDTLCFKKQLKTLFFRQYFNTQ
jgi:hypothetical protein